MSIITLTALGCSPQGNVQYRVEQFQIHNIVEKRNDSRHLDTKNYSARVNREEHVNTNATLSGQPDIYCWPGDRVSKSLKTLKTWWKTSRNPLHVFPAKVKKI